MMKVRVAGVLLWLVLCVELVCGIRFYLEPGQKRCFTEELPANSEITGESWISGGKGEMDIDIFITTTDGKVLFHKRAPQHGKFSFMTPRFMPDDFDTDDELEEDDEETFRICIEHQQHASQAHVAETRRSIQFVLHQAYKGEVSSKAASMSDMDRLQNTMRQMHTTLSGMIGDLTQLQRRERLLTEKMEKTNSRVVALAVFGIVVAVGTGLVQFKYYQGYFKQKKLC